MSQGKQELGILWMNGKKETLINFILIISLISLYFIFNIFIKNEKSRRISVKINPRHLQAATLT